MPMDGIDTGLTRTKRAEDRETRWSRFAVVALCLAVAGCGADSTTPTPAVPSAAHRAEAVQGSFRLVFELPRTTWKAGEAIDGVASLAVADVAADLGGSGGGLLGFDFAEANGARRMGYASTADCRPYRLDPGTPMTSGITKSVGFDGDDPNAAFYRAFIADPVVRLPAGDWTITAIASFVEGKDCTGASHTLAAPIVIHVTP